MDDDDDYGSDISEGGLLDCLTQAEAPSNTRPIVPTAFTNNNRNGGQQQASMRQTTLFGNALQLENSASALGNRPNYRGEHAVQEAPTHHELDKEALATWVYPTNLGAIRDYQYSIVKNGLFNNTLVALPTGLGKTFIAATVMLNFYRWTKKGKIIFVAPTKPLCSQQVDACFSITGIPRAQTTLLTGETSPGLRAEEWQTKRIFFMTPQTLMNDLSNGMANPKDIVLLVIDEAHRATGEYAYAKVVKFMRRFTNSFRVLALTATPGAKIETVQEVIDNLGISHIEIRTEESLDIRQYVHKRVIDIIELDPSDEMEEIKDLFSKALRPLVDKLSQQNIYWGRDPMTMSTFTLLNTKREWLESAGRHVSQPLKFMIQAIFGILQSLAHGIKLLNFHGIKPFYLKMNVFQEELDAKGKKGSKLKRQLADHPDYQEMMKKVRVWVNLDDFVSHPKISSLCDTVRNHFLDRGESADSPPVAGTGTRIIVFSEFRDSAEDIVQVLNRRRPLVRPAVFVGQADSNRSEGMKQKQQLQTIQDFKSGKLNVLVATSIGEEGLDIGQVDLIICYDASASPIRMLQRMGRTGRKRAGHVVLLLMRGAEKDKYDRANHDYNEMQTLICEGSKFAYRYDLSTKIVPQDAYDNMVVDKRAVEIPLENTQNTGPPEPKKGRRAPKRPAKKFHMPDDVETGFQRASDIGQPGIKSVFAKSRPKTKPRAPPETDFVVTVPPLATVCLSKFEAAQLKQQYKQLPFSEGDVEDIEMVELSSHPTKQRALQKTQRVGHGSYTKRCVELFGKLGKMTDIDWGKAYDKPYGDEDTSNYRSIPVPPFGGEEEGDTTHHPTIVSDDDSDADLDLKAALRRRLGEQQRNQPSTTTAKRKFSPKSGAKFTVTKKRPAPPVESEDEETPQRSTIVLDEDDDLDDDSDASLDLQTALFQRQTPQSRNQLSTTATKTKASTKTSATSTSSKKRPAPPVESEDEEPPQRPTITSLLSDNGDDDSDPSPSLDLHTALQRQTAQSRNQPSKTPTTTTRNPTPKAASTSKKRSFATSFETTESSPFGTPLPSPPPARRRERHSIKDPAPTARAEEDTEMVEEDTEMLYEDADAEMAQMVLLEEEVVLPKPKPKLMSSRQAKAAYRKETNIAAAKYARDTGQTKKALAAPKKAEAAAKRAEDKASKAEAAAMKKAEAAAKKAQAAVKKAEAAVAKKAKGTKRKGKGAGGERGGRVNNAGEDYGDSCMRSDDLILSSDGDDRGTDLEDWLVGDDVCTSSMRVDDEEDDVLNDGDSDGDTRMDYATTGARRRGAGGGGEGRGGGGRGKGKKAKEVIVEDFRYDSDSGDYGIEAVKDSDEEEDGDDDDDGLPSLEDMLSAKKPSKRVKAVGSSSTVKGGSGRRTRVEPISSDDDEEEEEEEEEVLERQRPGKSRGRARARVVDSDDEGDEEEEEDEEMVLGRGRGEKENSKGSKERAMVYDSEDYDDGDDWDMGGT